MKSFCSIIHHSFSKILYGWQFPEVLWRTEQPETRLTAIDFIVSQWLVRCPSNHLLVKPISWKSFVLGGCSPHFDTLYPGWLLSPIPIFSPHGCLFIHLSLLLQVRLPLCVNVFLTLHRLCTLLWPSYLALGHHGPFTRNVPILLWMWYYTSFY